ncbi:MAG: host attachment protein [Alphaproteobacteria bacterium]|nr:host attachment protein [Alphaproteobacteria bacterium]
MDHNNNNPLPHKKASRIWIIVADSCAARVFTKNGHGPLGFGEITPKSETVPDLSNKSVGRVAASARGGQRHKYEPRMNKSRKSALAFAREMAQWLDEKALANQFEQIVLVAAPKTLGILRIALSPQIRDRIIAEVNKELTGLDDNCLREKLSEIVWF